MMPRVPILPLAVLLALAACSEPAPETGGERKTAAGEVLGGSVSDAMLPLDTVQSQGPVLAGGDDDSAGDDTSEEDDAGEAAPRAARRSAPDTRAATPAATRSPAADAEPAAGED